MSLPFGDGQERSGAERTGGRCVIKTFLSSRFWRPFSNISFACYLTHPVFILIYIGLQETPIHYSDINFMYLFLGNVVLTLPVAYVLCVLVEKPYVLLKSVIAREQVTPSSYNIN